MVMGAAAGGQQHPDIAQIAQNLLHQRAGCRNIGDDAWRFCKGGQGDQRREGGQGASLRILRSEIEGGLNGAMV